MRFSRRIFALPGAANELAEPLDWIEVPFGAYEHPKGIQILNAASAADVIAAFNEAAAESGFRGLPVYIGHPDVPSFFAKYRDHKAYAWVTNLAANETALRMRIDWTEPGRELITNEAFAYFSPNWFCRVSGRASQGGRILSPVTLRSLGLTQEPNIKYLSVACEEPTPQEEEPNMDLLTRIKALIGQDDINTEDEVCGWITKALEGLKAIRESVDERYKAENAAYETTENEIPDVAGLIAVLDSALVTAANEIPPTSVAELTAAQTKVTDLTGQITAANEALQTSRKDHAALLLDAAVEDGRIVQANRDGFADKFSADFEAAANELSAIQPGTALKTKSTITDAAKRDANQRDISEQITVAVNERMDKLSCDYHQAYMACKRDPKLAALFTPDSK